MPVAAGVFAEDVEHVEAALRKRLTGGFRGFRWCSLVLAHRYTKFWSQPSISGPLFFEIGPFRQRDTQLLVVRNVQLLQLWNNTLLCTRTLAMQLPVALWLAQISMLCN